MADSAITVNGRFLKVSMSIICVALVGLMVSHIQAIAELREWRRLTEKRIERIESHVWPQR